MPYVYRIAKGTEVSVAKDDADRFYKRIKTSKDLEFTEFRSHRDGCYTFLRDGWILFTTERNVWRVKTG